MGILLRAVWNSVSDAAPGRGAGVQLTAGFRAMTIGKAPGMHSPIDARRRRMVGEVVGAVAIGGLLLSSVACDTDEIDTQPPPESDSPATREGEITDAEVPGGAPPFGTVTVGGTTFQVRGMSDNGGQFTACATEDPDRPGYVEVDVAIDEDRRFSLNVLEGNESAALGSATTTDVDLDVTGTTAVGSATFPDGTATFDITC